MQQISLIPFSIQKGDNAIAAINILETCCKALSPFSVEYGISDICCFRDF